MVGKEKDRMVVQKESERKIGEKKEIRNKTLKQDIFERILIFQQSTLNNFKLGLIEPQSTFIVIIYAYVM